MSTVRKPALPYQEDTLVLSLKAGSDQEDIDKALAESGGTIVDTLQWQGLTLYKVKTRPGRMAEAEGKLQKSSLFAHVDRNYRWIPCAQDPDRKLETPVLGTGTVITPPTPMAGLPPFTGLEYHLFINRNTSAGTNDEVTANGSGIFVAVLDSGCSLNGQFLPASLFTRILPRTNPQGFNAAGEGDNNCYNDTNPNSHGTIMASIIGATRGSRTTLGVAPGCAIYPVRIAHRDNTADDWSIMNAIFHLGNTGIRVACLAYKPMLRNGINQSLLDVVNLYQRGGPLGVVFTPAGNAGVDLPFANPLPFGLVLVGALGAGANAAGFGGTQLTLANYSNRGSAVSFAFPGSNIIATDKNLQVVSISGTSAAAAIAAGNAAVILSAAKNPNSITSPELLAFMAARPNGVVPGTTFGLTNLPLAIGFAKRR